jgi:ABC-type antimicrobial peptide transport system permease subunit
MAARAAILAVDSHILVLDMQPMEALVRRQQAGARYSLALLSAFAVVSTLLTGVGLYGVVSTLARQRTPEIGIRMVLGAEPAGIFRLVIGHGLRLSVAGLAIGTLAALGLTRAIASMLVGVTPTDSVTFATMAIIFPLIAAAASWVPARRAARLDPAVSLRAE